MISYETIVRIKNNNRQETLERFQIKRRKKDINIDYYSYF